jgi:hypothetical protein
MPVQARCTDRAASSGSGRWLKEELRAAAELGAMAGVAAIVARFSGYSALLGATVAIALFWLAVAVACLFEFLRSDQDGTNAKSAWRKGQNS